MIPEMERVIESLAPQLPIFDVQTMSQALNTLNGLLDFTKLARCSRRCSECSGLILAIVGVYGVVSFAASAEDARNRRAHGAGGAACRHAENDFREGLLIVGVGLLVGIAALWLLGKVVGRFLIVSARDPVTYIIVTGTLLIVALSACFIPARRAMRVDPMVALRYE